MITNNTKRTYKTTAKLIPVDFEIIKVYMLGAVNAFCNANPDKAFSVRILFGGNNRNWGDTPMQKIYDYYLKEGKSKDEASKNAAADAGKILKSLLERDSRKFEIFDKDTGTLYKLSNN